MTNNINDLKKSLKELLKSGKKQNALLYNVEGKLVKARSIKGIVKKKGVWGLK